MKKGALSLENICSHILEVLTLCLQMWEKEPVNLVKDIYELI